MLQAYRQSLSNEYKLNSLYEERVVYHYQFSLLPGHLVNLNCKNHRTAANLSSSLQ